MKFPGLYDVKLDKLNIIMVKYIQFNIAVIRKSNKAEILQRERSLAVRSFGFLL